ncbi:MAG: hypothetical protein JW727_01620 [Candidatus Aenigmarchaeota archaeon]|nr:hypothetical protein [Candidatus Aenigmarchaeota archaeon]
MENRKYIPLIQKPDCCSAACLQMILFKRGFTRFTQEKIAKELGLYIGPKNKDAFSEKLKVRSKKSDINETVKSARKINEFFRKNRIPLSARGFKISQIENPEEFIRQALDKDYDLWAEFSNMPIYGTSGGHDCLISGLKKKGRQCFAELVDPYWGHKQVYLVPLDRLIKAMQKENSPPPARERGIVVITGRPS